MKCVDRVIENSQEQFIVSIFDDLVDGWCCNTVKTGTMLPETESDTQGSMLCVLGLMPLDDPLTCPPLLYYLPSFASVQMLCIGRWHFC